MTIKLTKRIICAVLSVFTVITVIAGCSNNEVYRLIKVKSFEGAVTVEREEKMNAFEGLQLISEDKVEVGNASFLELLADSDKHIAVEENTAFKLLSSGNEKSGNITVEMLYGKSFFTIDNKLPEGSTFEVNTPNAMLSVRGTIFSVTYDPETNETSVKVMEGVVAVTTAEETMELTAGKTATITSDRINRDGEAEKAEETEATEEFVETEEVEETTEEAETDEETEEAEEQPKKFVKSAKYEYYQHFTIPDKLTTYSVYDYDSEGTTIRCSHYEADGRLILYDLYEYDSYGNNIKESSYKADGTLKEYWTYEYNSNGDYTKRSCYEADGTLTSSATYEYKYDSDNNLIEHIGYNNDGIIYYWVTREYNSNDKLTRINWYEEDGTLESYGLYEYDSYGNSLNYHKYNADGTIVSYEINEYDSDGRKTKSTSYNADGTCESYYIYEYDSDGCCRKYSCYNGEGILKQRVTNEYWE